MRLVAATRSGDADISTGWQTPEGKCLPRMLTLFWLLSAPAVTAWDLCTQVEGRNFNTKMPRSGGLWLALHVGRSLDHFTNYQVEGVGFRV